MLRISAIVLGALALAGLALTAFRLRVPGREASEEPFIAFSLREATRLAAAGPARSSELLTLGGITRVLGMVHDPQAKDVILVGRALKGQPGARFDDLVVALRTRLLHDQWPMVSIDPTEDTARSGRLQVNFRGGIQDSPFGRDFLDCDIILKKYSMELLPAAPQIPSYKALCSDSIEQQIASEGARATEIRWFPLDLSSEPVRGLYGQPIRAVQTYQSRFWFCPREPYRFVARDGVFCIKELQLNVQAELSGANAAVGSRKQAGNLAAAAEQFSAGFSEHFQKMCEIQSALRRLKILYDLVAVAEGIRSLGQEVDMNYLLHDYQVSHTEIPADYQQADLCAVVDRSDGLQHVVKISGGVELSTELKWLNDGDVSPLRAIVLKARPSAKALSWRLPLEGWEMPNSKDLPASAGRSQPASPRPAPSTNGNGGCSLQTESFLLTNRSDAAQGLPRFSGFGGMSPLVSPALVAPQIEYLPSLEPGGVDISPRPVGERKNLRETRDRILRQRHDADTLAWPIEGVGKD